MHAHLSLLIGSLLTIPIAALAEPATPPSDPGHVHIVLPKAVIPIPSRAQLSTDRQSFKSGERVKFSFTIVNPGRAAISYTFPSSQEFEITVADSMGKAQWRWSRGRMFAQVVSKLVLNSGETKTFSVDYNLATDSGTVLPPGKYEATAQLTPMPRFIVSGGILVNPEKDPNNLGVRTKSDVDSGATLQNDVTPSVAAKTSFVVTP
jgi:hypothetical protein